MEFLELIRSPEIRPQLSFLVCILILFTYFLGNGSFDSKPKIKHLVSIIIIITTLIVAFWIIEL